MLILRSVICCAVALCAAFCTVFASAAGGSVPTPPRTSPAAQAHETAGTTQIAVSYSRPSVRGRTIWGALVPWDKVWRAGADEATRITFSHDVVVEGSPLAAGTYSFFAVPAEQGDWTAILNGEAHQWGLFNYDASKDVLRLPVAPETVPFQEELSYVFSSTDATSTTLRLLWAEFALPLRIETTERSDAELLAMARETFQAARLGNRLDRSHVVEWLFFLMDREIRSPDLIDWAASVADQPVFAMLRLKAKTLAHQGRYAQAVAAGEEAMEVGTKALDEKSDRFLNKAFVEDFADLIEEWRSEALPAEPILEMIGQVDLETDPVLAAIRTGIRPTDGQMTAVTALYQNLRHRQMRAFTETMRERAGERLDGKEGDASVMAEVFQVVAAANASFLTATRDLLDAEQQLLWDTCVDDLQLQPLGNMPPGRGGNIDPAKEGLQVGQPAPDFELMGLDGQAVSLHALRGKPVVIEFASLSCPMFRGKVDPMRELAVEFGDGVHWLVIYTREAHAAGTPREAPVNPIVGIEISDHESFPARLDAAARTDRELAPGRTIVVDTLDDTVTQGWGGFPNWGFVLDAEGRVVLRQVWSDPEQIRRVLQRLNP